MTDPSPVTRLQASVEKKRAKKRDGLEKIVKRADLQLANPRGIVLLPMVALYIN